MAMMRKKTMKMSMLGLKNSFQWKNLISNVVYTYEKVEPTNLSNT
jgi:hypothetical protein